MQVRHRGRLQRGVCSRVSAAENVDGGARLRALWPARSVTDRRARASEDHDDLNRIQTWRSYIIFTSSMLFFGLNCITRTIHATVPWLCNVY